MLLLDDVTDTGNGRLLLVMFVVEAVTFDANFFFFASCFEE